MYYENIIEISETVETVRDSYPHINHQLFTPAQTDKLVVNEIEKFLITVLTVYDNSKTAL